jgi:hypothetical protein
VEGEEACAKEDVTVAICEPCLFWQRIAERPPGFHGAPFPERAGPPPAQVVQARAAGTGSVSRLRRGWVLVPRVFACTLTVIFTEPVVGTSTRLLCPSSWLMPWCGRPRSAESFPGATQAVHDGDFGTAQEQVDVAANRIVKAAHFLQFGEDISSEL